MIQNALAAVRLMFASRLSAVCALLAMLVACGNLDPDEEYSRAMEAFAQGEYRTSAIHLSNVVQADPGHAEARQLRGRLELVLGNAPAAARELEIAASFGIPIETLWPDYTEALIRSGRGADALQVLDGISATTSNAPLLAVRRGMALLLVGDIGAARREFETVLASDAGRADALVGLARIHALRDELQEAESLLTRALASEPDFAEALQLRAAVYAQSGSLQRSVSDLEAAASTYADLPGHVAEVAVLSMLVEVNLALGDVDAAVAAVERLNSRAPEANAAGYMSGLVAYQQGRLDDAALALQQTINRDPGDARVLTLFGAVQLALGNVQQAEQSLLNALAINPRNPAASKLLAETRIRQSRPEAALDSLRAFGEDAAGDSELSRLRGLAHLESGRAEMAVPYLEQAVSGNPGNLSVRLELARAYLALGRGDTAIALLGNAVGADIGQGAARDDLLLIVEHLRTGDVDAGTEQAEQLLRDKPGDPQALTAAAVFYRLIGESGLAQQHLESAIAASSDFALARVLLAALLVDEDRRVEAEAQLEAVLDRAPENSQAALGLAQLAIERGAFGEAEAVLQRVIERAPAAEIHLGLAQLQLRDGHLDEAGANIERAAELAPDSVDVDVARGFLAIAQSRLDLAVAAFETVVERQPGRIDVRLALAKAHVGANDLPAARATLTRLIEDVPDFLPALAALGVVEFRAGDVDAALDLARRIQADYVTDSTGFLLEGEIRLAQRRYDAAAQSFRRALERSPEWNTSLRLAMSLQLAGLDDDVESVYRAWLEREPSHVDARLLLASSLQQSRRTDEAIAEYERVLAIDEKNVVALNDAAWLYHERGDERALGLARRAVEAAPESAAVLDTLGWIMVNADLDAEGFEHLAKAAQLAPEDPEIQYHLAFAQAKVGRGDQARDTLQRLVGRSGTFPSREAAEQLLESL